MTFQGGSEVRPRVFVVTLAFCLTACVLCLLGCEQANETYKQSASPAITEKASIDNETVSPASASFAEPSAEPTDDAIGENIAQVVLNTDDGVHQLNVNTEYIIDLDGDSVPDRLLLQNYDPWPCDVLYNTEKINPDYGTWIGQAHLIRRTDGSSALICQQDGNDSWSVTCIYTFTSGKASKAEYRDYEYSLFSPDTLQLTGQVFYFLGNQAVSIEATINIDFTLTLGNDGWFTVITAFGPDVPKREHRAKVDIPMQRLENGAYVDATLPAGTRVYPQLIDEAQTRMIIKTDDGTLWMYTRDSAGLHFEEGDLFDGCTYAGP